MLAVLGALKPATGPDDVEPTRSTEFAGYLVELVEREFLAAGWRPPLLDSETEWGYRIPDGFVSLEPSEAMARRWVDMAFPGQRVLVRREVGPWVEVQP